jgi:lysophospholipase L1-like esterase
MIQTITPTRALSAALLSAGSWLCAVNLEMPDESRWLGAALVLLGALGLVLPARASLGRALEVAAVLALFDAGGEWMVHRETAIAAGAYGERLIHFVDDRDLRYEMKPFVRSDVGVTNEHGMLDVPRSLAKPPGVFRVACLGDSVGGDFSLPTDNACAQLERLLDERGVKSEVLNFSVPGYNTLQEARALELKARRFSPDAVVVLYVMNDPFPDLAISHHRPGHLPLEHALFGGLCVLLGRVLHTNLSPIASMIAPLYEEPRAWQDVVVAGFRRIAAAGLPTVVAVFPLFVEDGARFSRYYRQVVDEAGRHGLVGLDLSQAAFAGPPLSSLLKPSRDPIHPNAHAHAMAARAIADALLEVRR